MSEGPAGPGESSGQLLLLPAVPRAWLADGQVWADACAGDPELTAAVDNLGLPSLQTAWLLASAYRAEERGDLAARDQCAERALGLCTTADVPLALHLRALALGGLEASARALVRTIAAKFRDRRTQKRFAKTWENGARV